MRILTGILTIALLAAWSHVAPVQAQCDPAVCANPGSWGGKAAKAKPKKVAAKKQKKPAKEQYMRIAP